MSKKLRKVTVGFVVQEYVLVGDTFVCVGQEFTCGDDVTWEDESGEVVSTPADHVYQSFEMEPVSRMSAEEEELVLSEFNERVRRGEEEDERWRNSERLRVEELRLRRVEELRRDEKRGLYPGLDDPAN